MKNTFFLLFIIFSCWSFSQDTLSQKMIQIDSLSDTNYIILPDNPIVAALDSMLLFYKKNDYLLSTAINLDTTTLKETPVFSEDEIKKKLTILDDNSPFSFNPNNITIKYIRMYEKRRTSTSILLARKETYFPIFEELLLKYKLPLELKYLPVVESALKPDAESWAGASGLWQFMYNTGKRYGLEADSYMDLRRDPYKATEAACQHLAKLYAIYENWELVLAAYNAGGGNVNKAIRKAGGKKDYWEIFRYLPKETQGYVPAFIAVNYMMNHASDYNIYPMTPLAIYHEIDTVMVSERVDLNIVSKFIETPIDQLKYINPTYYHGIIPKRTESLCLFIPSNKMGVFLANKTQILNLSKETKKTYTIPKDVVERGSGKKIKYRVKSGDYLGKIANKYDCKVRDIKKWNNLRSNKLKTGQLLVVYSKKHTSKKKDSSTKKSKPIKLNPGEHYVFYTIKKGDTLWDIAANYPGVSVDDITNHNPGLNSNNLKLGNKIKIIQRD